MARTKKGDGRLYAKDLAEKLGRTPRQWRRILEQVEQHHEGAVLRAGDGTARAARYVTAESVQAIAPRDTFSWPEAATDEERAQAAPPAPPAPPPPAALDPVGRVQRTESPRTAAEERELRALVNAQEHELRREGWVNGQQRKKWDRRKEKDVVSARIDVTCGMQVLLGMSPRDVRRRKRWGAGPNASAEETAARAHEEHIFEQALTVCGKKPGQDPNSIPVVCDIDFDD